jgi:small basic protein
MKRFFITSIVSLVLGLILGLVAGRRMPPSREQVANYLSNLSVGELSDFTRRLTAQWGFQAFPQHLVPGMPTVPAEPSK